MNDSILNYLPPANDKRNYRLQASLSLEEAAQLEHFLSRPDLPFQGDMSTLVRTLIRSGLLTLHHEFEADSDSFVHSMKPVLGSEFLKWSAASCDAFAIASTDHLALAIDNADPTMGEDVVSQVIGVIDEVKHPSANAMIKKALMRRGFVAVIGKLRQVMIDNDRDIYHIDSLVSEVFG